MVPASGVRRVAMIGSYVPRKCGIATFTHDVRTCLTKRYASANFFAVAMNDSGSRYDYPSEVKFEIQAEEKDYYYQAAKYLNAKGVDAVSLQHEYGIFGGKGGDYILHLLRHLDAPVVATLHTVLANPRPDEERVLSRIIEASQRLIVMTQHSRSILEDKYGVSASKIDVVAHGIPDTPFLETSVYKEKKGLGDKLVGLTFGLIYPTKGIEYAIQALPAIVEKFPNFVYIVLGATHPALVREHGEKYRHRLEKMARDLGVAKNVIFENRYVSLEELTQYIMCADVYITPYLNEAQSVSGTLAYSFGCGRAVVSTPYLHARELLADGRGMLVPFADSTAISKEIISLFGDEPRWKGMCENAYKLGRAMTWRHVAKLYMESFNKARQAKSDHSLGLSGSAVPSSELRIAAPTLQLNAFRE